MTGTLRYNLDPFNQASDERITELIRRAKLEYLLEKEQTQDEEDKDDKEDKKESSAKTTPGETPKPAKAGLNYKITENGGNLAVGEKQLLCIVRAILKNNQIVVLDEATANIDVVTEETIQKLITEEFKGATVLTIAHRLNTIIKSDKILMLDKGGLLEQGSPKELLLNPESNFTKLAKELKKEKKEEEKVSAT